MMRISTVISAFALAAAGPVLAAPEVSRVEAIAARMADPDGGIIMVAHRGCHNPSAGDPESFAPENSFAALDKCIALGIDVVEIDVRRTRDGHLVLVHDESVDRTTNGRGRVRDLTLADIQALHLRDNQGGPAARITTERVLTLEEALAHAGDRIMLCLDVKDAILPEVIAAVHKAGATGRVFIQPGAAAASPPLASIAPYDGVPIIPAIMGSDAELSDLPQVLLNQASGPRQPWGYSLPWRATEPLVSEGLLARLVADARQVDGRIFVNTMGRGTVTGFGGDSDALRDPDSVWGRLYRAGITMFQTDQPEALAAYAATLAERHAD